MITVSLVTDNDRVKMLSEQYNLEGFDFMSTCEGETEKALAAVRAEGETLYFRLISAAEDDMAEMAIRAALAYGDNRGALIADSPDSIFEKHLKRVGFTENDGVYSIEICKVVHYCG